jgi:hypothetical protein
MTSEKLQRSTYRDPTAPGDPVRSGNPTRAENALDMDQYYRPLERIHSSGLHGWGVASGLRVTATLNSPGVTMLPGVALDSSGRHISLAADGSAEIGQNADAPGATPTLVTVAANGVVFPTSGLSGDKYVTIQFWETFDTNGFQNLGTFRYFHTPWLRLLDVPGFSNDGSRLVLARVSLASGANAGQVTALAPERRQATDLPTGSIHLQRSVQSTPAGNAVVETAEAGVLHAHATGGLDLTVPNATDEVHLARDDGGNFAKVSLGAEKMVTRRSDGVESVVIDTPNGNITASGNINVSVNVGIGTTAPVSRLQVGGDLTLEKLTAVLSSVLT